MVETKHSLYEMGDALTLKAKKAISVMEDGIPGGMECHIIVMRR